MPNWMPWIFIGTPALGATIILDEVGLKPITYAKAGKLEEKTRTKGKIGYRILTKSKK